MHTPPSRALVAATAAAVALFLAGCGDDESSTVLRESGTPTTEHAETSTSGARADFNDADITFLEQMYPHHAQAIEMAQLASSRAQDPQIQDLATAIEQAQEPEMATITALLESFGRAAPGTMSMDHSGHSDGTMTAEQMQALEAATGAEFDRMFLTLMIKHHQGAIDMANDELANGVSGEAKQLAQAIVAAQQTEVDQMNTMLSE